MTDTKATKFYIRHREGYPETEMQAYALQGFRTFGVETAAYDWVDDIDELTDLSPTVGVAGYIGDVHRALTKMGKHIPANVDYPSQLKAFMGRTIEVGTLEDVRRSVKPLFVKPVEHKLFSGFVYTGDGESRRHIVMLADDVPVLICEPINILAEYRSFILEGEVLDCRRYKGDYGVAPSRYTIETAVEMMKGSSPRAYCLDWGIIGEGADNETTILVEMNEGYSFGHYGLAPTLYARMLSARWNEMTK